LNIRVNTSDPGDEGLYIENWGWCLSFTFSMSFGMHYKEGKLSFSWNGDYSDYDGVHYRKRENILDMRKGGEVALTRTCWSYHESQPEVVMVTTEVVRAIKCQE